METPVPGSGLCLGFWRWESGESKKQLHLFTYRVQCFLSGGAVVPGTVPVC